ncbi:MAG: amino acid permease [Bacteroidetes bacterium]|nr:amino acid permease [Bacteroidota bacterium]
MNFSDLFRKKSISGILKQIEAGESDAEHVSLAKHLGVRDLTAFGIAAIIGAGIFSTIGTASADGGPGVIFLFAFTAIACGFAGFAYAEFASMVPVSGSAYTYSYVAFGELIAWVIGWALIMEYAVGNVTVAVSWSDYFTGLLDSIHIGSIQGFHVPEWASIDYVSASSHFQSATDSLAIGKTITQLPTSMQTGYNAWVNSPSMGGFHLIADLPAIAIIIFITWLVYIGIKETRNASNAMVVIKLCVVLLVISVGIFHVDTENWNPFLPNGVGGVLKGVSSVFFAYIGFDAISTTAEECKNPRRDLPRGMMYAIIICTILYILVALVLTGMVKYDQLAVGDPLAFVFGRLNMHWFSGIIAVSAVIAMTSVLLVFQMGQPRIWMSMSRDGLLPKKFAKIHRKYKTPSFATVVTGFVVAIPTLFIPSEEVLNLCSMGTLFAFVLVCAGVLKLRNNPEAPKGKFKTPYLNAKFIMPALSVLSGVLVFIYAKNWMDNFLSFGDWGSFKDKIPMWLFLILALIMSVLSFTKNLSLIPVLGLIFCFYMMAQIPLSSWFGFMIWLIIGLVIYFSFGIRNSKLNKTAA